MSTVDVCLKLLQGKATLTVDQVNRLKACSCNLQCLVICFQIDGDGLEAVLQSAGGGEILVRSEHPVVSRDGIVRFIESQGLMAYRLFYSLNITGKDVIHICVTKFVLNLTSKIDSLVALRDSSSAPSTSIFLPVLPPDLILLASCPFCEVTDEYKNDLGKTLQHGKLV